MNNKIITLVLVLIVILGGGYFLLSNNNSNSMMDSKSNTTASKSNEKATSEESIVEGYQGKVLAGSTTLYLDFNQEDYEKALLEKRVVFLNFYANWCPICRAEIPDVNAAFDSLTNTDVIGFRINYNDTDTDSYEKMLAQEFQIPYQHTKVILVNGQEVFKETAQWDTKTTVDHINQYSN